MEQNRVALDGQKEHWEETFGRRAEMFGQAPSGAARKAAELFEREGKHTILELGAGQGRDTLYLAERGFRMIALDYASSGLGSIRRKSQALGLSRSVQVLRHDARDPLPFRDESFDGCYSHMLYCMALTMHELQSLSGDIRRILRPGGINIYTVRNTDDADYGQGIHRGEDLYEVGGFVVHFFNREKVLRLAEGWKFMGLDPLEEGKLPRRLFCVTLRRPESEHRK